MKVKIKSVRVHPTLRKLNFRICFRESDCFMLPPHFDYASFYTRTLKKGKVWTCFIDSPLDCWESFNQFISDLEKATGEFPKRGVAKIKKKLDKMLAVGEKAVGSSIC